MANDTSQAEKEQRAALNRLKRARGQLNAVIDKFESGGDCTDVIHQLSAVTAALNKAGYTIIASAMRNCVTSDDPEYTPEQLERAFISLA